MSMEGNDETVEELGNLDSHASVSPPVPCR